MKALITGDSHLGSINMAYKARKAEAVAWPPGVDITVRPLGFGDRFATRFFEAGDGRVEIIDAQMKRSIPYFPIRPDVSVYGLSAPLQTSRVLRHAGWRTFAPISLIKDERGPVSLGVLKALVLQDQRFVLGFIDHLRKLSLDVFAIEAPRPSRRHPALGRGLRPEVAAYVDQHYRQIMRAELAKRSVPLIELPTDSYDQDGFMLDKYMQADDPFHANVQLGELLLQRVVAHLASLKPRPPRGKLALARATAKQPA